MSYAPDISVVIVTWNVERLIGACLNSVRASEGGLELDLWVVDNGSKDRSPQIVAEQYPQVNLTCNSINVGFPKANNQALIHAQAKYALLLNPDTEVDPQALMIMYDYLENNQDVLAVGPKILRPDGTVQFDCVRALPTMWSSLFDVFYLSKLFPHIRLFSRYKLTWWDYQKSAQVECLSGACMMIRRDALEHVGFLDETLFMYLEDIDICAKLLRIGGKLVYLPEARIIHHSDAKVGVGASTMQVVEEDLIFSVMPYESLHLFFLRYHGSLYALIARAVLAVGFMIRMLVASCLLLAGHLVNRRELYRYRYLLAKSWALLSWSVGRFDAGRDRRVTSSKETFGTATVNQDL